MTATIRDIAEGTDAINLHQAEAEKIKGDIERAREAVQEAEGFQAQIDAVSRKRAEAKAHAFVEGKKADTKELDKQEADLERASRQAKEDAAAAVLAIELLQEKLARVEAEIATLSDHRRQLTIDWLIDRRDKAIDRYIAAIVALEQHVIEAAAADQVRRSLDPGVAQHGKYRFIGEAMLKNALTCNFALPRTHYVARREGLDILDPPVPWLVSHYPTGKPQHRDRTHEILQELEAARGTR
jgi:seryl-tRNA synthetase